jgi:hypothetical protein
MSVYLKTLLIIFVVVSHIGCLSPPPQKDEYQETLETPDEYQKSLEEYNRQLERQLKAILNTIENLRQECSVIRQDLKFANYKLKEFQQANADFMLQLNEQQLELYSEYEDSLKGNSTSKFLLYSKKLANSINEKQIALLQNLNRKRIENYELATDLKERISQFENKKKTLLDYLKLTFSDDPQMYEIIKLDIEKDLTY